MWMPTPGLLVLALFMLSALYVHYRGKVRFSLVRGLTSYMVLLAPYNVLMYLFSRVPATPYLDLQAFPELSPLQQHWRQVRDEALRLQAEGGIRAASSANDIGFNSFFRTGWKRFYLKWYGADLASARQLCPFTVALLDSVPGIKAAMFASLPPGARLVRHRDPFASSLRYHLGLVTPNDDACFIVVDGEKYSWRVGAAVMFDETYIHFAENGTDQPRVILFCDVERPLRGRWIQNFNRCFANTVMRASSSQNVPGEPVGVINRVFARVYGLRARAKKLKERSRFAYYLGKWVLIAGLVWLIFLSW